MFARLKSPCVRKIQVLRDQEAFIRLCRKPNVRVAAPLQTFVMYRINRVAQLGE